MFGGAGRRRRHTLGTRGRYSVWRRARLDGLRTVATSTPVRFLGSQPDPRAAPPVNLCRCAEGGEGMQAPVEIAVDEVEQVVARVAGIDVAKASGMVCTRMPHESVPGRRVTRTWQVKSTTTALGELADHPRAQGIERIVVESTSDYWRPFFSLLQAAGLSVWLVNAAQVKHVPGRPKTDKPDAGGLGQPAGEARG